MNGSELKQKFDEAVDYANAESYQIKITSSQGNISPNGIYNFKISDGDNLFFTANSDYQFIRWIVWDEKANKDISDEGYITIDDAKKTNTNFTFAKVPENISDMKICLMPMCEKRPKIVSATPAYDSNGVYRDRRISVMFNKIMDESSIYYTDEEIEKITADGFKLLELDDSGKFYGYWDGSDPKSIVFKNISITKRTDPNFNLLYCYKPPYLDTNDKSVLRIDTKSGNAAPVEATDILVTIGEKMACNINSNFVNLGADYEWAYRTNTNIDTDPPLFVSLSVQFGDENQTDYKSGNKLLASGTDDFNIGSSCATYNLRSKKVWLKGGFEDGGSGPNSLKWNVYKIDSKYYPCSNELVYDGQVDNLLIMGATAEIKQKKSDGNYSDGVLIDLPLKDTDEGLYRLEIICTDKNEKTDSKSYYFVHDVKPPAASTFSYDSTLAKDIVVMTKNNSSLDFGKTEIAGNDYGNGQIEIKNLGTDSRVHNNVTVKDYDYSGNCRTSTINITAEASVGYIFYDDCYWSSIDKLDEAVKTGRKPVGIILGNNDDKISKFTTTPAKVKIIAIDRDEEARFVQDNNWSANYPYGWSDHDIMAKDGLKNYNLIVNNKYGAIDHSEVHKYLYEVKNNYNKNKIIWYLPAVNEYLRVNGYSNSHDGFTGGDRRYEFDTQLEKLKSKGYTTLSTYAKIAGDNSSIQEIISSTIYNNSGHWAGVTTYWYGNDFYLGFNKDSHQNLKTRALYMAQVDMD